MSVFATVAVHNMCLCVPSMCVIITFQCKTIEINLSSRQDSKMAQNIIFGITNISTQIASSIHDIQTIHYIHNGSYMRTFAFLEINIKTGLPVICWIM